MHDPEFVLLSIRRPWPQLTNYGGRRDGRRWSWRPGSPFATVAGKQLYWPGLITVWHHEPGGRDIFEVCTDLRGRGRGPLPVLGQAWRHRAHLSVQLHPWGQLRRWALTRCSWCGGPSRFGTDVGGINLSAPGGIAGEGRADLPWWHGEQGLLHGGCSTVADAYRHCVCHDPLLDPAQRMLWSWCARCGLSRMHDADLELVWIYRRIREMTRRGHRPTADARNQASAMWQLRRAAKEASES